MATQYKLTLAGDTPVNQVAERAFPAADDRPTGVAPVLVADLNDRHAAAHAPDRGRGRQRVAEPRGPLV